MSDPYTRWSKLADSDISLHDITNILAQIDDDLWVAAECFRRLANDPAVQRSLLAHGISRTDAAVERARTANVHGDSARQNLAAYFTTESTDAQLCQLRLLLFHRLDRLCTFEEIYGRDVANIGSTGGGDVWEDDPWAGEIHDTDDIESRQASSSSQPPVALGVFLTQNLELTCFALAANTQFTALGRVMERHFSQLFPHRFAILEHIPVYSDLIRYRHLLPAMNSEKDIWTLAPSKQWRIPPDWVELHDVHQVLQTIGRDDTTQLGPSRIHDSVFIAGIDACKITEWYCGRIDAILDTTGMVDLAIELVQHAISLGVQGLDEIGEDLMLISRLVYDSPYGYKTPANMTLTQWRSLEPSAVVHSYLGRSTPNSIVDDIRRLVLPYLFVLDARMDRSGQPDSGNSRRILYEFILSSPLHIVAPIFEASKPTIIMSKRLIADDEDLARLALSCLYGNESLDEWPTMSRIFECLPAWNISTGDDGGVVDAVMATLTSLLSTSTPQVRQSPAKIFSYFKPLNILSLSRMLDILDVHLESGEILARWSVGVPLYSFLQSSASEAQQRSWATKMARQAEAIVNDPLSEDCWLSLLDDMLRLTRPEGNTTNSAFGLLRESDVNEIFFSSLLSAGKFDIARKLIGDRPNFLDLSTIERVCMDCSRELYDNASSGNLHSGTMKLAYGCLAVAQDTLAILREREFIEATSRISSYNLMSKPGVPILPIEIRLTKDKLSLVSRILSSNGDAYKHSEVILDLTRKLGFQDDIVAKVKTLAMIADTALQAEDFPQAFEASERMCDAVLRLRQSSNPASLDGHAKEAADVCWVACFQLGRYPENTNELKRLELLGRSLELCPPDKVADVLAAWHKLETNVMEARQQEQGDKFVRTSKSRQLPRALSETLATRLQNIHISSPSLMNAAPDAAALASQAFNRVAANFPFSIGRHSQEFDGQFVEHQSDGQDVQAHARHALQRGIGWLIGADENEL